MRACTNYNLKMSNTQQGQTPRLQRWLETLWYSKTTTALMKGGLLLLPLTGLYCLVNAFQRWRHAKQPANISLPVIVVGNITVGGTGKTPLCIALTMGLKQAGYKPVIITRGYGGQASHWPQRVTPQSDPNQVGDEAVLLASRTGVPVYAGADRLSSIKQLQQEQAGDVIISDDGMQHYRLPRDIQIAVLDGQRLLGNGLCLPAGPLREPKRRLQNCDYLMINSNSDKTSGAALPELPRYVMQLKGAMLVNLKTGESRKLEDFAGQLVHAVAGIGHPERFFTTLSQAGLSLIKHSFPDHHAFKGDDFIFNDDDRSLPIVMTEKDAVKCTPFANARMWYLPVNAVIDQTFLKKVVEQLQKL